MTSSIGKWGASAAVGVALAVADNSTVWVARDGGAIRICRLDNRGTAALGVFCSDWTP